MPEFIGRPRLPEQLAAMRLQMAQRNPTANALNELSQSIQSVLQMYGQQDMKTKLQNQLLEAKADQARAASEAANERFEIGQRGATIRGMVGKGWTPTPGGSQIPMDERISGQFPLGQNEVQTQQFPSSRTMMQLTDLLQAQGIRPRAGDPGIAFSAPAPKPVTPKAGEIVLNDNMIGQLQPYVDWSSLKDWTVKLSDWNSALRHANAYKLLSAAGGAKGSKALSPEQRMRLEAMKMASRDHAKEVEMSSWGGLDPESVVPLQERADQYFQYLMNQQASGAKPSLAEMFIRTLLPEGAPRPPAAPSLEPSRTDTEDEEE